jgi:hypothetical protein
MGLKTPIENTLNLEEKTQVYVYKKSTSGWQKREGMAASCASLGQESTPVMCKTKVTILEWP